MASVEVLYSKVKGSKDEFVTLTFDADDLGSFEFSTKNIHELSSDATHILRDYKVDGGVLYSRPDLPETEKIDKVVSLKFSFIGLLKFLVKNNAIYVDVEEDLIPMSMMIIDDYSGSIEIPTLNPALFSVDNDLAYRQFRFLLNQKRSVEGCEYLGEFVYNNSLYHEYRVGPGLKVASRPDELDYIIPAPALHYFAYRAKMYAKARDALLCDHWIDDHWANNWTTLLDIDAGSIDTTDTVLWNWQPLSEVLTNHSCVNYDLENVPSIAKEIIRTIIDHKSIEGRIAAAVDWAEKLRKNECLYRLNVLEHRLVISVFLYNFNEMVMTNGFDKGYSVIKKRGLNRWEPLYETL